MLAPNPHCQGQVLEAGPFPPKVGGCSLQERSDLVSRLTQSRPEAMRPLRALLVPIKANRDPGDGTVDGAKALRVATQRQGK